MARTQDQYTLEDFTFWTENDLPILLLKSLLLLKLKFGEKMTFLSSPEPGPAVVEGAAAWPGLPHRPQARAQGDAHAGV